MYPYLDYAYTCEYKEVMYINIYIYIYNIHTFMLIQFFMHTYMHVGVYIYLLYIHTYNHYICVSLNISQSWVSSKFFLFFNHKLECVRIWYSDRLDVTIISHKKNATKLEMDGAT